MHLYFEILEKFFKVLKNLKNNYVIKMIYKTEHFESLQNLGKFTQINELLEIITLKTYFEIVRK